RCFPERRETRDRRLARRAESARVLPASIVDRSRVPALRAGLGRWNAGRHQVHESRQGQEDTQSRFKIGEQGSLRTGIHGGSADTLWEVMPVHVIADTSAKLAGVRSVLERRHAVTSELLRGLNVQRSNIDALVIRADLRAIDGVRVLKQILAGLNRVEKRIFLVEDSAHLAISQAYALGATVVLTGPLNNARLLKEVADLMSAELPEKEGSAAAAASAEVALASMFSAVAGGVPIDVAGTRNAGAKIADAVEEHGLADWL